MRAARFDLEEGFRLQGQILLDGQDIYDGRVDVPTLRRRVGMLYAVPTSLPWTIRENIVFGPRMSGVRGRAQRHRPYGRS